VTLGVGLATDSSGKVYGAATTTYGTPLTYSNGVASIQAATAAQNGYLSLIDWGNFQQQDLEYIALSSLSARLFLGNRRHFVDRIGNHFATFVQ
jgi:hypothetical protein